MSEIQAALPVPTPDLPVSQICFQEVMEGLLNEGQILERPSDMGLSCLSYALYRYFHPVPEIDQANTSLKYHRLCLDAATAQHFSSKDSSRRGLSFPNYNKQQVTLW